MTPTQCAGQKDLFTEGADETGWVRGGGLRLNSEKSGRGVRISTKSSKLMSPQTHQALDTWLRQPRFNPIKIAY